MRRERRRRRAPAAERGAALFGLLVTLVVLGATAGVVLAALPSQTKLPTLPTVPTTTHTTTHAGRGTTTTTQRSIVTEALIEECVADVQSVASAAQNYEVVNGALPRAGATWATTAAHGGPFLQSWPLGSEFTVRWSGRAVVVAPTHGRAVTGTGTSSPATGCYAV